MVDDARATGVTLNGVALPQKNSAAAFAAASRGWFNAARNLVLAKSGVRSATSKKTFKATLQAIAHTTSVNLVCDKGWTAPGDQIYAVGNLPGLGNWDPGKGIKLSPSVYYEYIYNPPPGHNGPGPNSPKWTGLVQDLPANAAVEWKCARKLASGQWQWQGGSNNTVAMPEKGFAGSSVGAF